jgi:PAS domain S-box-containing protein
MKERFKLAERILDSAADAIICADRSRAIVRWNRAATALFGYSAEEALGQNVDLIIPEHLRVPHHGGFTAAMERGASDTHPRAPQERPQALCRDEFCDCQRRQRKRGDRRGRRGAGRHGTG